MKGISANVNIQAFSILIKLPLVVYLYFKNRKTLLLFLFALSVIPLCLIFSRGAFLALFFIVLLISGFHFRMFKQILLLLFTIVVSALFSFIILNPKLQGVTNFSKLTIVNESTIQRLSFYKGAITSFVNTFPFGIGIGNWKVESIFYYKEFVQSYVVPYHAHNDFLQIAAESGLFGLVAYISFFIFLLIFIYNKLFKDKEYFYLPLLASIGVFFIDSNLNFPISRPLIVIQFVFIVTYIIYTKKTVKTFKFPLQPALIIFLLGALVSSFKVYKSLTYQDYLMSDFASQNYDTSKDIISKIDPNYPNLAATTLPIKSLLANYYSNDSIIDHYLDLSIKDNPHIKYPQVLKSIRFNASNQIDSAYFYAEEAYNNIPNNELHSVNFLSVLTSKSDIKKLHSTFYEQKDKYSENFWNAYFLSLLKLEVNTNDSIISLIKEAKRVFKNHEKWNLYELRFTKGEVLIKEANELFLEAEKSFSNKEYEKGYSLFMKASKLIPEDPAYLENAAHALYMSNKNNEALKLFDSVIDNYNNGSGKAHYLKGLMLLETQGNKYDACKLFQTAIRKGHLEAQRAKKLFCQ